MGCVTVSLEMRREDDPWLTEPAEPIGGGDPPRRPAAVAIWTVEQFARQVGCSVEELRRRAAADSDLLEAALRDRSGSR